MAIGKQIFDSHFPYNIIYIGIKRAAPIGTALNLCFSKQIT